MKRDFKFRVWDKMNNKFIYSNTPNQPHFIITLDGKFYNLQNGSGGDEYVIQQAIGLKDVDGNDIYEGDFLKPYFDKDSTLTVKWDDKNICFDAKYHETCLSKDHYKNSKIVGNIFQTISIEETANALNCR